MDWSSVYLCFLGISITLAATTQRIADHEPPKSKPRQLSFKIPQEELSSAYWNEVANRLLKTKLEETQNKNRAKNVIMFLGDGMSVPTLTAARIYKGQLEGKLGESTPLAFEEFPVSGLSKTYCVNHQVADSACTATAYLCGVKTNNGIIGVNANVTRGMCHGQKYTGNHVESIALRALRAGKEAGIVTTTSITDASPAGAYAHIAERKWESDADIPADEDPEECVDIARQLITHEPGRSFKVILGGGRQHFYPKNEGEGRRIDGINLVDSWYDDKDDRNGVNHYVTDRNELAEAMVNDPDYLMGLFSEGNLDYHLLAKNSQPTLEEMTEAAIQVLSKSDKGFFLFVEGGRIDHGHHDNKAKLALDETLQFSNAIAKAVALTDSNETLIVVTSDHAHVMTMAGYPTRGNDILAANDDELGDDGIPYTTLGYNNGPGYRAEVNGQRIDITSEDGYVNRDPEFRFPSMFLRDSETHGGDDVAVFARGPWSHLFTGSYEQNIIPHAMAYALCLDDYTSNHCL